MLWKRKKTMRDMELTKKAERAHNVKCSIKNWKKYTFADINTPNESNNSYDHPTQDTHKKQW
jgi:hypothetical protein